MVVVPSGSVARDCRIYRTERRTEKASLKVRRNPPNESCFFFCVEHTVEAAWVVDAPGPVTINSELKI